MSTTLPDDADDARPSGVPLHPAAATVGLGAVGGALAGVALGVVGGPIGMVIGGIVGAVGGAGLGDILGTIQNHRSAHEERVDEDIGVIRGDLGAADPDQPPAFIGAYSSGAAGGGATSVDSAPDEGPMPRAG